VRIPGEPPIGGRYRFQLIATFENRTRQTIYLGRALPDSPEPIFSVAMDGPGISGYNRAFPLPGHDQQFEVPPGETRTHTLDMRGPGVVDRNGVPLGVPEGRMRIYYSLRSCRGTEPCERGTVASEPFTVTLAP
jgi:hypothetical protein